MADTLCGPSTALQQFQKHSTVDRTLQQDRLRSRHSPSQGFRSFPGPNSGLLDPEYDAFQAGPSAGPALGLDFFQPDRPSSTFAPAPSHSASVTDWAADFQRLHLSNLSNPLPPTQFRSQAPLQRSSLGGWHQDFMRQQAQAAPQESQLSRLVPREQYEGMAMGSHGMQGHSLFGGMNSSLLEMPESSSSRQQAAPEAFDDAAFELAFEAATSEQMPEEQQEGHLPEGRQEETDSGQQILLDESAQNLMNEPPRPLFEDSLEDLDRIAAEALRAESVAETARETAQPQQADDGDELARTAGELLNSVKDNQSQKFQQSSFLALMRQLRDKEVVVEGNDMMQDPHSRPSSAPHANTNSDPTMTGAINAADMSKFDDMTSCGLASGSRTVDSDGLDAVAVT
ncbi:MAG: hypothetical protein M1832_005894 [Thelocarpon impressellum]|nr:MAG: hypothetical protein M1832_005894 [Thelocarpon impressellum]